MPRKPNTTNDAYYDSFPTALRDLMKKNNVNQETLARELGFSRQTISQYCSGASAPGLNTLVKIAKYFDVSTDFLLGVTNVERADTELRAVCEYTGLSEKTINRVIEIVKLYSRYGVGVTEAIDGLVSHRRFYQVILGIANGRMYANLMKEQIKKFTLTVDRLISDGQRDKAAEMLNCDEVKEVFSCCTQFKLMRFDASEFATEIISDILQYQSGIDAINDFDEYVNTRNCELEDALSEVLEQFDGSDNLPDEQEGK